MIRGRDIVADQSMEALGGLQDAEHIFVIDADGDVRRSGLYENAVWQSLPAVKERRVYEMNDKYWMINGLIASRSIVDDVLQALAAQPA